MADEEKIKELTATLVWLGLLAVTGSLAVGGLLWRNAHRLQALNSEIEKQKAILCEDRKNLERLRTTVAELKYGKSSGVRATATQVPKVEEKLYDVNVWIDTASFPQPVREVRYEFQSHSPTSSNVPEIGFGAYFRDSLKCPETSAAIVTFADGKSKRIHFDLCQIAGLMPE